MYVLKELPDEVGERCPQRKWHTHRHKDKGHSVFKETEVALWS